jgi:hypothetical protein
VVSQKDKQLKECGRGRGRIENNLNTKKYIFEIMS